MFVRLYLCIYGVFNSYLFIPKYLPLFSSEGFTTINISTDSLNAHVKIFGHIPYGYFSRDETRIICRLKVLDSGLFLFLPSALSFLVELHLDVQLNRLKRSCVIDTVNGIVEPNIYRPERSVLTKRPFDTPSRTRGPDLFSVEFNHIEECVGVTAEHA